MGKRMEQINKRVKRRINISVTEDTGERLKQYAKEHHTNVSQALTDWIWSVKVKETNKE
jgi:ABC-type phosphonate transport system ATPase subunit